MNSPATALARERILLHICCAPCSPYVVGELARSKDVTLYYYNPNIHPHREYERRCREARRWSRAAGYDFIEGDYDPDRWVESVSGLESEPERGARCEVCIADRMAESARMARKLRFDLFGTVLTVSPRKDAALINRLGAEAAERFGVVYLESNWKKKDGYKISSRIADELGFYRQSYCGCRYSSRSGGAKSARARLV